MDELVRWLGEQLAEDERIARGAGGAEWLEFSDGGWVYTAPVPMTEWKGPGDDGHHVASVQLTEERAHIVRHNPARVLREIEAKRATIREYEKAIRRRNELVPNTSGYRHWDNRSFGLYVALRHMVAVYADRPGYAEALAAEKAALLADE